MSSCAVKTCMNHHRKTRTSGIKYYRFPKDPKLLELWITACGRDRETILNLKHATVCSIHFDANCIEIPLKMKLLNYQPESARLLKEDSVPTLHLPSAEVSEANINMDTFETTCDASTQTSDLNKIDLLMDTSKATRDASTQTPNTSEIENKLLPFQEKIERSSEISSGHCKDTEITADESVVAMKFEDEPHKEEIYIMELQTLTDKYSPSSPMVDIKIEKTEIIEDTSDHPCPPSIPPIENIVKCECSICDYTCQLPYQLKVHMLKHTRQRDVKCSICNMTFAIRGKLNEHMRTHNGDKSFKCSLCDYSTFQRSNLTRHIINKHSDVKPVTSSVCNTNSKKKRTFKCPHCDFTSTSRPQVTKHMATHRERKSFKCSDCDFVTERRPNYVRHMRTHTGDRPYKCPVCDYAASDSQPLKLHMRRHTGEMPVQCDQCGKRFVSLGELKLHMRIHTGEKRYKCSECDYAARQKSHLKYHFITRHSKEKKPFKCPHCDYGSAMNSALKAHVRMLHPDKAGFQLPIKCPVCPQHVLSASHLTAHMRVHTGERPYKCTLCDFAGSQSGQIRKHMRKHTGERQEAVHPCTECGRRFQCPTTLKRHVMSVHTKERPFNCSKCDYGAIYRTRLLQHMQKHHPE